MNTKILPQHTYDEIPSANLIEFGSLISISLTSVTNAYTHSLHRYPAKFIPQIPRWAIRQYSNEGDFVLDPFSGSGTTMVEAAVEGREGIGVDLDHLACLIGTAKTVKLNANRLSELGQQVIARSKIFSNELCVPLEGIDNFNHWFSTSAWSALQAIESAIDEIAMSDQERSFFLATFSSIIRAVSNADDQSQKTYVSGTLKKTPPPVAQTFQSKLNRNIESTRDFCKVRKSNSIQIVRASATQLPLEDGEVDLIVTSPPYLDSVDYMYNSMLEYFWLGKHFGFKSRGDYNAARRNGIGSKSSVNDGKTIPMALKGMIDVNVIPKYRRSAVAPYFLSMEKHFREAARVLKPGGRYVLIIGNSRTQEGMLPLHDALVALASSAGLHMEHAFAYRIRRHYMKFPRMGRGGIILMDWVVTLHKGDASEGLTTKLPLIDEKLPDDAVAN